MGFSWYEFAEGDVSSASKKYRNCKEYLSSFEDATTANEEGKAMQLEINTAKEYIK